jgi:hypothetical protein
VNVMRVLGRLVPLMLASIVLSMARPPTASADSLVWKVRSNYRHGIQIAFYSQSRLLEWPGNGQAWGLNDSGTHKYTLTCVAGETICFGAWVTGHSSIYWGIGAHHEHSCDRCCYVCGAGETARQILD